MRTYTAPVSRTTDPETSHRGEQAATDSGSLSLRRRQVLETLRKHNGSTSSELAQKMIGAFPKTPLLSCIESPHKRLPELESLGYVRRTDPRICSITGHLAHAWEVKE